MTVVASETITTPTPSAAVPDALDGLQHYVCMCRPRIAMCGKPRPATEPILEASAQDQTCAVCADLDRVGCPGCGE